MSIQKASGTCVMRLAAYGERKLILKPRVVLSCVITNEARVVRVISLTSTARLKIGSVGEAGRERYRAGDRDGGFNATGFNRKAIPAVFILYGEHFVSVGETARVKTLMAASGTTVFHLGGDITTKTVCRAESTGTRFTLGANVVENVSRYRSPPGFDLPFNHAKFNTGTPRRRIAMYGMACVALSTHGKSAAAAKPKATANITLNIAANTTQIQKTSLSVRLALQTDCAANVRHYALSTNGFTKPFNLGRFNAADRQMQLVFYGESRIGWASSITILAIVEGKPGSNAFRLTSNVREVARTLAMGRKVNLQLHVDGAGRRYGYGSARLGFGQPFNRHGFNAKPSGGQVGFYASERVTLRSSGTAVTLFRPALGVGLSLSTSGHYRIRGVSPTQDIDIRLAASASAAIARFGQSDGFHRMFNRAGFNVWAYDRAATRYGVVSLSLDTRAYCRSALKPQATLDLRLRSDIVLHHKAMFPPEQIDLRLQTSRAVIITGKRTEARALLLLRILPVRFYTQKSEFLTLHGLTLRPGDVLRIDTENCVATVNGVNVMEYLTDDSAFFYLLNGENLIFCENGGANAAAEIKVMWRNRYL